MLRLPLGSVTVLLGPGLARRRVMARLDEDSARCATGRGTVGASRVTAAADDSVSQRLTALDTARAQGVGVVLVDRFTDGLSAEDRRSVLKEVRKLAEEGRAVLVDDVDPVAALTVASNALRIDRTRGLVLESLDEPGYLAS